MQGIVTFLIGIDYRFLAKGRHDKSRPFMTGLLIGFVLAFVFGLLGAPRGLGLPGGFVDRSGAAPASVRLALAR